MSFCKILFGFRLVGFLDEMHAMLFWNVEFILKESFETQWVKIRHLYINKLPGNTEESCAPSGCLNWDLA